MKEKIKELDETIKRLDVARRKLYAFKIQHWPFIRSECNLSEGDFEKINGRVNAAIVEIEFKIDRVRIAKSKLLTK